MLNFTRGTYLKSLCNRAHDLIKSNPDLAREEILPIIDRHLSKIQRSSTGYWGITESDMLYSKMLEQLKKFIMKANTNGLTAFMKEALSQTNDKVKIVFLAQETVCWSSLESFYFACKQDERFIAQLVYIPFTHVNADEAIDYLKIYREDRGLSIVNYDEYSLTAESPDIAVYVKPYDCIPMQYYITDVDKVINRCILISYGFEIASWAIDYHFKLPLQYKAWKFIVYGDKLKELAAQHGYNNGRNVVAWGHPRADYYNNLEKSRENIPDDWRKKIKNRKVVLWNTQHTVTDGTGCGTFFKWKNEVLSYFDNNLDIVLLWRPHPLMFGAIANNGLMTDAEVQQLISIVEKKDNIILDCSPDYRNSFYASDAIITDGTSFLIEYLCTEKPLIYTPREDDSVYFQDEICENIYIAKEEGDIIKLLDDIKCGTDLLKEKRLSFAKNLLRINPEGNGEYIKNQIYINLMQELEI